MKLFDVIRNTFVPATTSIFRGLINNIQLSRFLKNFFGTGSSVDKLEKAKEIYRNKLQQNYHSSNDKIELENIYLTQAGILVFYHLFKAQEVEVLVMLFEASAPLHALWHQPKLIMEFPEDQDQWQFISLTQTQTRFEAIWHSKKLGQTLRIYPKYRFEGQIEVKNAVPLLTKHHQHNPMIRPHHKNSWEAFTTFNPAAFFAADQVHILYRAQGYDYVSQVGYATSNDGLTISERISEPIYRPREVFEGVSLPPGDPNNPFVSGGGCGGVEDPRVTVIDDRIYMTYVAYDGWNPPRVALTSISLENFLNRNFLWEKAVLISPPGVVDKSAVIFPEKINGKYVIMHRVFPDILIDYVDSLDFAKGNFLQGHTKIEPRSRAIIRLPSKKSGTFSVKINCANPSATAVLPTPGSPIKTGLFFVRRAKTAITSSISFSRPITGSKLPSIASLVTFSAYSSKVGVGLPFFSRSNKNFSACVKGRKISSCVSSI